MQLGETIATYDVALALRGESGKFDVTSPTGEIYHVTCKPNHSITNLQCSGNAANPQPFLIRKVAEPVSSVPERTVVSAAGAPTQTRVAKTPFLINADENDPGSEKMAILDAAPEVTQPVVERGEISSLDLLYTLVDRRPTAWVCLGSELQQGRRELISSACTTFNQFDAEIRRLHAQLDDIRYRARKRYYEAQAVAAGA